MSAWPGNTLTSADAAPWRIRVPTAVLTVGPLLSLAVIIAVSWNSPDQYSGTIAQAASWRTFGGNALTGVALAVMVSAWFAPRICCTALALLLQPWVIEPLDHPAYWALVWLWPVIVVLDLLLTLRQRSIARWNDGVPDVPDRVEVLDVRGIRIAIAALLVVAAVAGLALWLHARSELLALGTRAVQDTGTVTSQDLAFDSVDMRVNGRNYEFYVNDAAEYAIGSVHTVFVDPLGEHRPYGTEDSDPDGWSDLAVPIGAAPVVAMLVGFVPSWRRRRLRELAASGPVWTRALVREHPTSSGVEIFAVDDPDGRVALVHLPALEPCLPAPEHGAADGPLHSRLGGALAMLSDLLKGAEWDGLDDEWDADLDDLDEDWDEDDDGWQPSFLTMTEAAITGLHSDGSLCLIRVGVGAEAEVWANVRPARDRWTVRSVFMRPLYRRPARRSDQDTSATTREPQPESFLVPQVIRATAIIGPLLVAVASFAVQRWMFEGEPLATEDPIASVPAGLQALGAAWLAGTWWSRRFSLATSSRYGMRIRGGLGDVLAPAARIRDVRRLRESVTIDLDGDDRVVVFAPLDRREHERQDLLDETARIAEQARAESASAPTLPPGLPSVLPSSATLVAAVTALAALAPCFARF